MRIVTLAGVVLSFGTLLSYAQMPDAHKESPLLQSDATIHSTARVSTCPINMAVKQGIGSKMVAADRKGTPAEMFSVRLKLLLGNASRAENGRRIVKARVTVRGLNGKGQIVPAGSDRDGSGDVVRTMTVRVDEEDAQNRSADLRLPGFTSAKIVELEVVTFDNGDVWTLAGEGNCKAAPDPMMRVEEARGRP